MTRLLALVLPLLPSLAAAQQAAPATPLTVCVAFNLWGNPARLMAAGTDAQGRRIELWQAQHGREATGRQERPGDNQHCATFRRPLAVRDVELTVQVGFGGAWQEACRRSLPMGMNQRVTLSVEGTRDWARCR